MKTTIFVGMCVCVLWVILTWASGTGVTGSGSGMHTAVCV